MTEVAKLLAQQHKQLDELISVLEQELSLISKRLPEDLLALLEVKATLLETIESVDKQIDSALNARNNNQLDADEQALFDAIQDALKECKRKTAINAKAVEQSQIRVAHLRQVLIDLKARESLTYDKTGKPKGGMLGAGIKA